MSKRLCDPMYIPHLVYFFKEMEIRELNKLKEFLGQKFNISEDRAQEIISKAVDDKIIKVEYSKKRRFMGCSIAELEEIPTSDHDFYCYECHLPGDLLFCAKCERSEHSECGRKNPLESIYTQAPSSQQPLYVYAHNVKQFGVKCNSASSAQSDVFLCSNCRIRDVPAKPRIRIGHREMCFLMNYCFVYNKTWLNFDIGTHINAQIIPDKLRELLSKFLFKISEKTFDVLSRKLFLYEYRNPLEFICDCLDMRHYFGVFFGIGSDDYKAAEWFLWDITYDVFEILNCPDCYRYSHERECEFWFAKPCRVRHRLVFARCNGYPYWPAKIMRKLPNNQFDVRFFATPYSRSIIHKKDIEPLNAELDETPNEDNDENYVKALREVFCHQVCRKFRFSRFSYVADRKAVSNLMMKVYKQVLKQQEKMESKEMLKRAYKS